MRPAGKDDIIGIRGIKIEEIRFRVGGHDLRHETYLCIWLDVFGKIRIEDPVYDSPVVDRIAASIFRICVCASELDRWIAWSGREKVVRPEYKRQLIP